MEQDYNLKKWSKGCPNTGINCRRSSCGIEYVFIPAALGDDQKGSPVAPKNGSYNNAIVYYEATGNVYLYSSDGVPTRVEKNLDSIIAELQKELNDVEEALSEETTAREAADAALDGRIDTVADNLATETANRISADEDLQADIATEATARQNADTTLQNNITAEATARANGDAALNTAIASEATARQEADTNLQNQIAQETQARAAADTAINEAITAEAAARQTADAGLQNQIDAITASSDVKDIVGTKAELNNYDTSTLGDNDIIKVLQDESENNATTYYRWNATTQQFTLIGEEGPYYTKSQADTLLNAKQNTLTAGSNVQIVNDTISATDTTYTAGAGLALNGTQFSVDTTAIATQSDLTAGLATKQDTLTAGTNIQINNNTISATDTTYSDFTGTDGTAAGAAGLVPAPATTDAGKFLKADGTWETVQAGGGATIFYKNSGLFGWGEDIEGPLFYKDSSYQTPATSSEMYAACMAGTTYICSNQSDDLFYTEIVAASNYSTNYNFSLANIEHVLGYDCTISSYISSGTEYYSFHYNEPVSINVVQTTGSSTTDVMSQNAVTSMVYADPVTRTKIKIGDGAYASIGTDGIEIGHGAKASAGYAIGIGSSAEAKGTESIALGFAAETADNGVSLGARSEATAHNAVAFQKSRASIQGEVAFGMAPWASNEGYNNTNYRLLTGLYDPQSAHDAATKGYVDSTTPTAYTSAEWDALWA